MYVEIEDEETNFLCFFLMKFPTPSDLYYLSLIAMYLAKPCACVSPLGRPGRQGRGWRPLRVYVYVSPEVAFGLVEGYDLAAAPKRRQSIAAAILAMREALLLSACVA
jgi:hypothetical protein